MFVSYDIKGIQHAIFSVPKLKCIAGTSSLVTDFDENEIPEITAQHDGQVIFSGGGKGVVRIPDSTDKSAFVTDIVSAAHRWGLDVRIGCDDQSVLNATQNASQLFPFIPETLEGEPCSLSGLWPVVPDENGRVGIHPVIQRRISAARDDSLGKSLIQNILDHPDVTPDLATYDLTFFSNINPDSDLYDNEFKEASCGRASLGDRNRWAVIALDGNDVGRHLRAFFTARERDPWEDRELTDWLIAMSDALKECTRRAVVNGLVKSLNRWHASITANDTLDRCIYHDDTSNKPRLVLPFRPLILGGDDAVILCNSNLAFEFITDVISDFSSLASQYHGKSNVGPIWLATDGQLTMSGGILYCSASYPLHSAIEYAESLLASAKGAFRTNVDSGVATPAAIDWENVTESFIDTPSERRNRELRFTDREIDREIILTHRPYALEHSEQAPSINALMEAKQQLGNLPRSVLSAVLPALKQPWSGRLMFTTSIAKRHKCLADYLWESGDCLGSGWSEDTSATPHRRQSMIPDAIMLLEEEHRST